MSTKPTVQIITLFRVANYGSVLQAFATQEVLTRAGFKTSFADFRRPSERANVQAQIKHNFRKWNRNVFTKLAFVVIRGRGLLKQTSHFNKFVSEHLRDVSVGMYDAEEFASKIDTSRFLCAGSDQIWNTDYHVGDYRPFFLDIPGAGGIKFSLASSFGKESLSEQESDYAKKQLSQFKYLSVRESSGLKLLRRIGLEATQIVDPTLMLHAETWRLMAKPPNRKRYILAYQLHRSSKFKEALRGVRAKKGIGLVHLRGFWDPFRPLGCNLTNTTVAEFLGLLSNAEHVVTDSFHGTAFSLIFEKPLTAVLPEKYSERITSLLELLGATNFIYRGLDSITNKNCDFSQIRAAINLERERAADFISKVRSGG